MFTNFCRKAKFLLVGLSMSSQHSGVNGFNYCNAMVVWFKSWQDCAPSFLRELFSVPSFTSVSSEFTFPDKLESVMVKVLLVFWDRTVFRHCSGVGGGSWLSSQWACPSRHKMHLLFQALSYSLQSVYIVTPRSIRQSLSCLSLGGSSLCFYCERIPTFCYIS